MMAAFSGRKHPNRGRSPFRSAKNRRKSKIRVTYADGRTEVKRPSAFRRDKVEGRRRYAIYLRSAAWQRKRRAVLKRDGYRCQCGATTNLHVHHLTYARLYRERLNDLATLCDACHRKVHAM